VRVILSDAVEGYADPRGRVEIYLEPRDIWVGVYVAEDAVYVCPLPMMVIRVSRGRKGRAR
jgi:hypothetical protein